MDSAPQGQDDKMEENIRIPERDEYKGHPTLKLPMGKDKWFQFGIRKAEAIVEYYEEIEAFVRENRE